MSFITDIKTLSLLTRKMMLVVFQGDMILKYNVGHQYTPFLIEGGCSNLASVSVMKVALQF